MSTGVYVATGRTSGALQELWRFRGLLSSLVARDLKVRNRQSILGISWTMLSPMLTMAILTLIFSEIFGAQLGPGSLPLYVISGLLPWNLFSSASSNAVGSITGRGAMIRRVYVPKAIFPVAVALSSGVTFSLSLVPLAIVIVAARAPVTVNIVFVIIPILEIGLFALGIAMLLATIHVFFRDVRWFYDSALVAGFYATPVFYPVQIVGEDYAPLLKLNPLWWMLKAFRDPLVNGSAPELYDIAIGGIAAVVSLLVGWLVLQRYEEYFIDYV
jgi:ABC-type polysaccharide/polyol phosphate export permease